ncbi:MAG: NUDIX domain-containing protein [Anaerolineae bacterium]|nr:NUDIX domain-containing protein [Anaerolineae bacterium]
MIAAVVVVEEAGRFLLVEEAKPSCHGTWFLPGGHVEPGETVLDAAAREAREEGGLEVALAGLLYVDHLVAPEAEGFFSRVRFVFVARPTGGRLKVEPDEHSLRAGWFTPAEMGELPLRTPWVRRLVDLYSSGAPLLPMSSFRVLG